MRWDQSMRLLLINSSGLNQNAEMRAEPYLPGSPDRKRKLATGSKDRILCILIDFTEKTPKKV